MKGRDRAPDRTGLPRDYRAIWKSGARHLWSRDQDALRTIKRLLNKVAALELELRTLKGARARTVPDQAGGRKGELTTLKDAMLGVARRLDSEARELVKVSTKLAEKGDKRGAARLGGQVRGLELGSKRIRDVVRGWPEGRL